MRLVVVAYQYVDTEREVLAQNRCGRTFIQWMTVSCMEGKVPDLECSVSHIECFM